MKWTLRRRDLLKSLGLGAGALPLLLETKHRAQAATPLGRSVVFVKGNGCRPQDFWPTWKDGRPTDGSLATAQWPHVTAPLKPFASKSIFLDGLTLRNWLKEEGNTTGDNGDAHHNWGSLLTGRLPSDSLFSVGGCRRNNQPSGCRMQANGPSIDAAVGRALAGKDAGIVFDSVHLSLNNDDRSTARRGDGYTCPSWFDKDQPNPPEPDPQAAFEKLFGGPRAAQMKGVPDTKTKDQARLLDYAGKDLQRFARKLGRDDQVVIEAHLDALHRREEQLIRLSKQRDICAQRVAPGIKYQTKVQEHIPELSRFMIDLSVDALSCGLTRSVCFSIFDTNGYHAYFTWLKGINENFRTEGGRPVSDQFHSITHGHSSEPAATMYRDANRWQFEQYTYCLEKLNALPEGNGTMLDNTLVLWAESLANGAGHTVKRLPWVLCGNVANRLKTGRHIALPQDTAPNGLFAAMAQTVGAPMPGDTFGDKKFGNEAYAALV